MVHDLISQIPPSATLLIEAEAKRFSLEGKNVISLAAGEPYFLTPSPIREYAKWAMDEGYTKYSPVAGLERLKQLLCKKLWEENGIKYTEEEIIVCCGAKEAIFAALFCICKKGDEVIIPAPFWVSYPWQVKLVGAIPKIVPTKKENGFKLTASQLAASITERTKALIINTPNNPTGAVYTKEELLQIAELVEDKDIFIISDEVYEKMVYDGEHISIASLSGKMKEKTITVNAFSKTFSMTGWRVGYAAGPLPIIQKMTRLKSHTTSGVCTISQMGAIKALEEGKDLYKEMCNTLRRRRQTLLERMERIKCLKFIPPSGAFYLFVDASSLVPKYFEDSRSLCKKILEKVLVATVPGQDFGADGYIRLSFAVEEEKLKEALKRLEDFFLCIE